MNINLIILAILLLAVLFALRSIIKKRKNGGCCGGCSEFSCCNSYRNCYSQNKCDKLCDCKK
ncbi:MAG: FeoB-associated Cys-rich membrane protein [Campylobacter sp.]|nr:FeoB-associated Cys-rich membrane protein [Campylobacter sp.]MBQ7271347.1 FeoB-associated Cys-rich membrane protein [Campylobacter sp.]MBQ7674908.1 FeoB-associated Cys-rich membrane protein [Campylobacter sp.]MBQ9876133.1 FeoB-associated Cys-rich membrane protein [Campylobacter sp.]MBR0071223.1 FeoB-associated Cys-rich membrane protein [Campylobacter sp.]